MRHIDRVTVKGSIEPMDLYTCDVDVQNLMLKVKVSQLDKYGSAKMTKAEKKKLFRPRAVTPYRKALGHQAVLPRSP